MRVRFGDFVLDSEARELTRQGRALELSPKALELLTTLVLHRPRAISKLQLHDLLWPATAVSDNSLARVVAEVRKVIGDKRQSPRFVRTVHGFGYAFCGSAADASGDSPPPRVEGPSCEIVWGELRIGLQAGENVVGRALDCAVRVEAPKVSRRHARILVAAGQAVLEDLGSKNGTRLRGRRITAQTRLADGDEIGVGSEILVFRTASGIDPTQSDRMIPHSPGNDEP